MIKSCIRVAILILLFVVAYIGILSTPIKTSSWLFDLLWSKGLGILAAWGIYKLYPRWAETDKWVSAYDRWCSED